MYFIDQVLVPEVLFYSQKSVLVLLEPQFWRVGLKYCLKQYFLWIRILISIFCILPFSSPQLPFRLAWYPGKSVSGYICTHVSGCVLATPPAGWSVRPGQELLFLDILFLLHDKGCFENSVINYFVQCWGSGSVGIRILICRIRIRIKNSYPDPIRPLAFTENFHKKFKEIHKQGCRKAFLMIFKCLLNFFNSLPLRLWWSV